MKIRGLGTYDKKNITFSKELQRVVVWRQEDILNVEYDTENEQLTISNLTLEAIKEDKEIVNFCSVKIFEAKDYWNSLTQNNEIMTLELESVLRPIIITNHLKDLKSEIKKDILSNKKLKDKKFADFIKNKKLHERWLR